MGQLRKLFTEGTLARLLTEEDDSTAHETGASGESLDSQVDRYLGQYEQDAKKADDGSGGTDQDPTVGQMESLDWRDLIKGRVLLTEAGEEDKDTEGDATDAAPGADALTGADDEKPGVDTLDVESFANDVVRLIDNYDSLLEVRNTLLRRATSFLSKNYSDEVVTAFQATMRDDHGMEAGKDKGEIDSDRFPAPNADRAAGSAEPGAGGAPPA